MSIFDREKGKDEIFFHDLINQIHNILLFIKEKKRQKIGINLKELETIENETSFALKLIEEFESVPSFKKADLHFVKKSFEHFISLYQMKILANFSLFDREEELKLSEVDFNRVFLNIFKNISQHGDTSKALIMNFNKSQDYLFISFENTFSNKNMTPIKRKHLGIQSIKNILNKYHGYYEYEIRSNRWISRIYLPVLKEVNNKDYKTAA